MSVQSVSSPTVRGHPLGPAGTSLGSLRATVADSPVETLRQVITDEGYLYLPGFFNRDRVLGVRRELVTRLATMDLLAAGTDPMDAVLRPGATRPSMDQIHRLLAADNAPLRQLLYGTTTMGFWESFLGGPALHFDYTWLRVTPPGVGTGAHTDIVFMGRGTKQLYTTWVPYGDIPVQLGGLAVLERGQRHDYIRNEYGIRDVDTFCENKNETPTQGPSPDRSLLDEDPDHLRQTLGGRWLTTDYSAGDVMIFGMFLPHVGIDNATVDRLRLSSDSRYQLASEAVDERWVGPEPVGHGPDAKVGMVC